MILTTLQRVKNALCLSYLCFKLAVFVVADALKCEKWMLTLNCIVSSVFFFYFPIGVLAMRCLVFSFLNILKHAKKHSTCVMRCEI